MIAVGFLYGIIIYILLYTVFNACDNNGRCSHFCLLSAIDPKQYTCDCPNGMQLIDNQTCTTTGINREGIIIIILVNLMCRSLRNWAHSAD